MTWLIYLWVVLLLMACYLCLFIRYHYRVCEHIEIMQCTKDNFQTSLLNERQPLVCTGFTKTQAWELLHKLYKTTDDSTKRRIIGKLSESMCHFSPWFSNMNTDSLSPESESKLCKHDVCLIIQLDGESSIQITHPSHAQYSKYTEVRLRTGDGLFIPFRWYYKLPKSERMINTKQITLCWTSYTTQLTESLF